MFIIPIGRKPDWRRPPVVTLLLILINCLVFFGPQSRDFEAAEEAVTYYGKSHLPKIEFPRYRRFLADPGIGSDAEQFEAMLKQRDLPAAVMQLQNDKRFLAELRAERIVRPDEREYAIWKEERAQFERLYGPQKTEHLAFVPVEARPATLLSHMFLHGSLGHLFGNMLLLLLVGYIVEEMLGRMRYLAFYLLGGLGAVGLYWLANSASDVGLVGASGAISAVMGMYTVLFGMRRIEFFYSVFFYFDIAKAPAIALLPAWLANELYQMWTLPFSRVAYLAHVGGLITGAALVYLNRRFAGEAAPAHFAKEDALVAREEAFSQAEALLQKLQFDKARRAFGELAKSRPDDLPALLQFYALSKPRPDSDDYQRAAALVFSLRGEDAATVRLQAQTYAEYVSIAKPIRLGAPELLSLGARFAANGHAVDAERIVQVLLRGETPARELPRLMLQVIKGLRVEGAAERGRLCRDLLLERFPDSDEARLVRSLPA